MIIITRPSPEGEELTNLLIQANITAVHRPLFSIKAGHDLSQLQTALNRLQTGDMVITVSPQVAYIIKTHCGTTRFPSYVDYFAVGQKSAQLFSQILGLTSTAVCRAPLKEDSEGLLQLLEPQQVAGKTILILRGNSGRELLAEVLTKQGARTSFIECYQRQPIDYASDAFMSNTAFPCFVVTSVSHLLQLDAYVNSKHKDQATLVVSSPRIFEQAKLLTWQKIRLTQGASNKILFKTIAGLCHNKAHF